MSGSFIKKTDTKSSESEFFKKITRLFSGPISNYQRQFPYKPQKKDLYKYPFKDSANGSSIKNVRNPFRLLLANKTSYSEAHRLDRYIDYNQMEFDAYMATALDIYANEIVNHSILDPLLSIDCPNDHIKEILRDLFYNVLNIEYNLRPWVRDTCKFGDCYVYIEVEEGKGIRSLIQLPQEQMERLEGLDEENPNYIQFQWNEGGRTFEFFEVAHFRIPGNGKFFPYGTSVLEPARRHWRQLELMTNHMIAYRVVRSGEKKVIYLQVGHLHPDEIDQYIEKTMTQMKRSEIVDPDASTVDRRYSPYGVEEDIIIPVRGDISHKIENLSSTSNATIIDDIEFIREMVIAALKIPQTYLARAKDGGGDDQSSLAQKNITFANAIGVIQQHIIAELVKMAQIHLYSLGFRGKDLVSFKISLCSSSKLAQSQELQNLKTKLDIAKSAETVLSRRWFAEKILGFNSEEFSRIQTEKFADAKFDALIATIGKNAEVGGGDEFGGDLGSIQPPLADDMGIDDMGAGAPDDMGAAPEPEKSDEEDVLLAAPGYRLKKGTKSEAKAKGVAVVTPGAKGKKYTYDSSGTKEGGKTRSWRAESNLGASYIKRNTQLHEQKELDLIEEIDELLEG